MCVISCEEGHPKARCPDLDGKRLGGSLERQPYAAGKCSDRADTGRDEKLLRIPEVVARVD